MKSLSAATATKVGRTTLGGAANTVRLKKMFPKTTSIYLDFYELSKPLVSLLCCNVPHIATREEYLSNATKMADDLETLARQLRDLA